MDVFICQYYIEMNKTEMPWDKIRVRAFVLIVMNLRGL